MVPYKQTSIRERMVLTLISISNNHHFIIIRSEFDMAVPLLLDSIERSDLIFSGIPIYFEILLFLLRRQLFIQPVDNLLIGSTLERDRFTFVVET